MKRTVGGDMSQLLEHDQLSKEMKDSKDEGSFDLNEQFLPKFVV